jgi:hypothetical protein
LFDILARYIVYYEHEERENGHDSLHAVTLDGTATHPTPNHSTSPPTHATAFVKLTDSTVG